MLSLGAFLILISVISCKPNAPKGLKNNFVEASKLNLDAIALSSTEIELTWNQKLTGYVKYGYGLQNEALASCDHASIQGLGNRAVISDLKAEEKYVFFACLFMDSGIAARGSLSKTYATTAKPESAIVINDVPTSTLDKAGGSSTSSQTNQTSGQALGLNCQTSELPFFDIVNAQCLVCTNGVWVSGLESDCQDPSESACLDVEEGTSLIRGDVLKCMTCNKGRWTDAMSSLKCSQCSASDKRIFNGVCQFCVGGLWAPHSDANSCL